VKCRREGVAVPAVYAVDEAAGWLMLEWVAGCPVRVPVNSWLARRREDDRRAGRSGDDPVSGDAEGDGELVDLMRRVGVAVGKLHKVGIIHGDLTTSNMMLRPWEAGKAPPNGHPTVGGDGTLEGEIVIIDFGLASQGSADEDRAVDLYVLERAFASTHPRAEGLFSVVLDGYRGAFKQATVVLKKLEEVRMRGRKRSMLG
jgi:TP53 regulating kinase and related kinases